MRRHMARSSSQMAVASIWRRSQTAAPPAPPGVAVATRSMRSRAPRRFTAVGRAAPGSAARPCPPARDASRGAPRHSRAPAARPLPPGMPAAGCSDETGPNRRLSPTLAGDSSVDSTPPGKPGPVASVTVTPSGDTVAVRDSAGFFATLRDAQGNVISDSHVKWSVADPTVARVEGEFGQSVILRALRSGSTLVTARSHGKRGSAELLVVEALPTPPPNESVAPGP